MSGILGIWNDCAEGRESAYEEWYQSEHLIERLNVPGFQIGRRYEAIEAVRRFLTTYEVEHPNVLTSADYRQRLENPTERTSDIMRNGFENMRRTVCQRHRLHGPIRGAIAITLALREGDPLVRFDSSRLLRLFAGDVVHWEIWASAEMGIERSKEEALRGTDVKISGCLEIELLRPEPALRLADKLKCVYRDADVGVYGLMCSMTRSGHL